MPHALRLGLSTGAAGTEGVTAELSDGSSAALGLLELPSNAGVSPVQCWVLQGAHCSVRVVVRVHPPSPGCAMT